MSRGTAIHQFLIAAAALCIGGAVATAGFHYCSVKNPGINSNHTCGDCFETIYSLWDEEWQMNWPVYQTCAINRDNPGGCYRDAHSGDPTPTCNINVSSNCGTGVHYSTMSDCWNATEPEWNVDEQMADGYSIDPETQSCVGSLVTVSEGTASGVNCTGVSPPQYFDN